VNLCGHVVALVGGALRSRHLISAIPSATSFLGALVAVSVARANSGAQTQAFDVVVYGGTPSGVISAIAAAREGARVALIEPTGHLGGMVSGGLSKADYGRAEAVGGYAREFFERAGKHYGVPVQWDVEPHVAEQIFQDMAREAGATVYYGRRLREKSGVTKASTRIRSITTEDGAVFAAGVYIDASYEGDLIAQAGVTYTVGREAASEYGEALAGVRATAMNHQFLVPLSPYDAGERLLPEISTEKRAAPRSRDRKVSAYNFRLCLTQEPANQVPFPKPARYDPTQFALLARMLIEVDKVKARAEPGATDRLHRPWVINDVLQVRAIANGKNDGNNQGAFSTDFIGRSYEYPDGDYATRARVWQAHADYVQGLLYFLRNDAQVPSGLRDVMTAWGLCADEFADNAHWPYQLYIREGRRMVGEYVMSQKDVQSEVTKPDVVGMGSYQIDSHNIQRIVNDSGLVENEGDLGAPTTPYQIPYRVLLPKRQQVTNLLVPVCLSATHVAYSTLRMEPVYMTLGHAAGVAAKMVLDRGIAVQEVDTKALAARLRDHRAILDWQRPPRRTSFIVASSGQPRPQRVTALLPDSIGPQERLRVVYVLPVEPDSQRMFGSALDEAALLDLQNRYRVMVVAPTFAQTPWYANHPTDSSIQQETFLVRDVIAAVDRQLPTLAVSEGRLLLGFSKSGWGAFSLVLRHPNVFGGAASWDAPMMLDSIGPYDTPAIFGSQMNFQGYRPDVLLRQVGRAVSESHRFVIMGSWFFERETRSAHALMDSLGVKHAYRQGPRREHAWWSGWMSEAFDLLLSGGNGSRSGSQNR
jgi:S-formylglutathione hydrolase FrmB